MFLYPKYSKVSKKGIEVLKMYVQAKQEKAMKLASQWGILSDLTTADLEEKPILDDTESESKAEEASTATQPEAKAKPASKWLDFIQNIFKKKGD